MAERWIMYGFCGLAFGVAVAEDGAASVARERTVNPLISGRFVV